MMRFLMAIGIFILIVQNSVAPPVSNTKEDEKTPENKPKEDDVHYQRYLNEVVGALESDPDFRKELEAADEADFRTGDIAHKLKFVDHRIRDKLHEFKRVELERLRHLATKEFEIEHNLDKSPFKIAEHLDHSNPHTFEIDDLKKLILKATEDLAEADKRRREEFKKYEMEKKFEEKKKLEGMTEEEKKKYLEEHEKENEKKKHHEKIHEPGSKPQLEEVWEKQDHMEEEKFNPKTFFYIHDLDGNGFWDQEEVQALFMKELDKNYEQNHSDAFEREEEMERMREHYFNTADLNKDYLIDYNEFLKTTEAKDFQKDDGWQTIDEQQIYSNDEYEAFERQRQAEYERAMAQNAHGLNQQYHQEQVPNHNQVYENHPPQYQVHPQQVQHQQYQGQPPIQNQQLPPQYQQGQIPVQNQQFQPQHQQGQGQPPIPNQQFQPQHQGQGPVPVQYQQIPVQQQNIQQQNQPQYQQHQIPPQHISQEQIRSNQPYQQQISSNEIPAHNVVPQNNQQHPTGQVNNQVPINTQNIQNQPPQPVSNQAQISNEIHQASLNDIKT